MTFAQALARIEDCLNVIEMADRLSHARAAKKELLGLLEVRAYSIVQLWKVSSDLRDYAKHLADHHVHGDQWHALIGFISSYDMLMKGDENERP